MDTFIHAAIPLVSLVLLVGGGIVWWSSLNYMKPGVDLSSFRHKRFSQKRELFADGGYRRYRIGQLLAVLGLVFNMVATWVVLGAN